MTTLTVPSGGGPGTHAFICGVGSYRHLAGGSAPIDHARAFGLAQLTSPPTSARAIADWLIAEMDNPDAPLASIELLLSPEQTFADPSGGGDVPIDLPTLSSVKRCFDTWRGRCDSDEANVALFYFAGHGLMREIVALLLEDFGADEDRPFERSIDFTQTRHGMAARCRARRQLFFVDACRQVNRATLNLRDIDATPLAVGTYTGGGSKDNPVLYASAEDDRAYGEPGGLTRMAAALLLAFRGLGAERNGGRWVVTTTTLMEAVSQTVLRGNLPGGDPQECRIEGGSGVPAPLHYLKQAPGVPVTMWCRPETATGLAELSLTWTRDIENPKVRAPAPGAWKVAVPPGDYDAAARFPGGEYRDRTQGVIVVPPYVDECLEVG